MTLDGGSLGTPLILRASARRSAADAVKSAEAAEFSDFYRAEFPRLAGYCLALVGSEASARDIAQEALVRVFSRWVQVDQPRAYAYLVATNLARRSWKRRAGESRALTRAFVRQVPTQDPAETDRPWLAELVDGLPAKQREVVLLFYYADLPVEEVARLLRLPTGTVKRRLHEARAALSAQVRNERR